MFTRTRYIMFNIFCECLHSLWPGFCSFCVLSLAIWEVAFHCQEVFIQSKFQSCAHIWRKWNLRPCHSNDLLPERPRAWTLNTKKRLEKVTASSGSAITLASMMSWLQTLTNTVILRGKKKPSKKHVMISWPFVFQLNLLLRSFWEE